MRRVTRRVRDAKRPKPLAAFEHAQAISGHWQNLAPQRLHLLAVEPRRAVEQPARVGEVTRAALVRPNLELRETLRERACSASVVEVDVR